MDVYLNQIDLVENNYETKAAKNMQINAIVCRQFIVYKEREGEDIKQRTPVK